MARARNIKPSLFKNELLGVADPLLTILFCSLWCIADREGRLEDRPLRIHAETFPYRPNLDVNGYLTELARLGFIKRYAINGESYIQVIKFKEHQSPHHTEKASLIPEAPVNSQDKSDGCGLTVNSPSIDGGNPPDSLIPDSLIPSSLIPDSGFTDSLCTSSKGDVRPTHKLLLAFAKQYENKTNSPMQIKWAAHGKLAKDLISALTDFCGGRDNAVDYICELIPSYFERTESKWWDFSAFVANFNKHQASVKATGPKVNHDRYKRVMISGGQVG